MIITALKKKLTARRGVSFYLSLVALVCAVAALILYITTGVTVFNPKLDGAVIALLAVGIAISVASVVFEYKLIKYVAFIIYLSAWFQYLIIEITYIANIFVSIDGTKFTPAFILTFALMLVMTIVSLVAAILLRDEFTVKKSSGEEGDAV